MKNVIEMPDKEKLVKLKKLAVINDLPSNNQGLVNLAFRLAFDCLDNLEEDDFINLFNLEK